MKEATNKLAKAYIRKVSENLVLNKLTKKNILKSLSPMVDEFCSENPDCSEDDIYNEFGEPEKMAFELLNNDNYKQIVSAAKKKTVWLIILYAVIAVLIAAAIIFFIYLVNEIGGTTYVSNIREVQ